MQRGKTKAPPTLVTDTPIGEARQVRRRDRHTKRVVLGLTGLLGAVWAVVIASRYTGILAG